MSCDPGIVAAGVATPLRAEQKQRVRTMAEKTELGIPPGVKSAIEAFRSLSKIKPIAFPTIDLTKFAKVQQDALAVFPALQKQMAAQMQPMADLQRQLQNIRLPSQSAFQQMAETAKRMQSVFDRVARPTAQQLRVFAQIAQTELRKRALDRIGLLPHPSTPFALLDDEANDDELRATLQKHYIDNWIGVSQAIQERAQAFDIDDEAKGVLTEALEAHQNGHYRAVCRLLLPEIERVARVELQGNEVRNLKVEKVIGEPALSLSIGDTDPPGYYALSLYERLTEHLYVRVDATNRAQLESDPVPNRHAAIHGLIVYSSFWHSLNVIFLTDYAFQIVTAINRARRAETARNIP